MLSADSSLLEVLEVAEPDLERMMGGRVAVMCRRRKNQRVISKWWLVRDARD